MNFLSKPFVTVSCPLIAILFFSSCKMATYTHVDAVIPPKYKLPAHIATVNVIDRSVEKTGFSSSKTDAVITATDEARNAMLSDIRSGLPVTGARILKVQKDGKVEGPATEIPGAKMSEYASGADGLLALEEFDFTETRTYKDIKKDQLDASGKKYTIEAVAGKRLIYLRTYWRLYDVKMGSVVLKVPQYTENSFETEGLTRQGINAQMDTADIVTASTLARKLSRDLIRDINPQQVKSRWNYYTKGHDVIRHSAKLIGAGDFRNAVTYLAQNIKTISEEKARSRASYNLVLSYYFNKQREQALQLAAYEYNRNGRSEFKELYDKIYVR